LKQQYGISGVAGTEMRVGIGTWEGRRNHCVWQHGVILGVAVGLVLMATYRWSRPVVDPDLWHEMALAREIVEIGSVPRTDSFAYTPTVEPVVHHEWGAGMIAWGATNSFGAAGIVALRVALSIILAALCWICARRRGATMPLLSFLAPLAIFLADEGFSTIRAQLYSFVCTAVLLNLLDLDRAGKRWWMAVWLPLFVFWLNVHAGFLVGAGLYAIHWLEQVVRRQPHWHLFLGGLVMIGLISVNPYGLHYYGYLAHAVTMSRPYVSEWAPLWFSDPAKIGVFLLSVAVLAFALFHIGPARFAGWPLILVTALVAIKSQRMLPFYAVAWFCYLPGALAITPIGMAACRLWCRQTRWLLAFWMTLAIVMGALAWSLGPWRLMVPGQPMQGVGSTMYYPVGGVEYLRKHQFRGNLMTPFEWGAYVSWRLHPQVKISMDGRYEVAFPLELVDELYGFYMAHDGWETVLDKYSTDAILVPKRLPLARRLPEAAGWRRCYQDDAFEIYVRTDSTLPEQDSRDVLFFDRSWAQSFPELRF
jgi:hypothetical protein